VLCVVSHVLLWICHIILAGGEGVAESEGGRRDVEETAGETATDRAGQTETGSGATSEHCIDDDVDVSE